MMNLSKPESSPNCRSEEIDSREKRETDELRVVQTLVQALQEQQSLKQLPNQQVM